MSDIEKKWYRGHLLVWVLSPLALLFYLISALRRCLYALGVKQSVKVDAPVIVVGNISVGGNGKTPVVLALAEYYKNKGVKVGILSRGYGSKSDFYPRKVSENDEAKHVGDEPRLLAGRSGCDVVIDPNRVRGATYLVEQCESDLIICDDGLQHYALSRDVELIVMDDRLVGSGFLLPMGPLREGKWRLGTVDAIIHNSSVMPQLSQPCAAQFLMSLEPGNLINVKDRQRQISSDSFRDSPVSALAGIGSPQRFFSQLENLGLKLNSARAFPDHHDFTVDDIPTETVIMTEKDAVKVSAFAHKDCWFLPVTANIDNQFFNLITNKLLNCGLTVQSNEKENENGI